MNPKKKIAVAVCLFCITLGFLVCGILPSQQKDASNKDEKNFESHATLPVNSEQNTVETPDKYILKILDGIVVVFKETDMEHPIMVTDIYASSLRNLDRERLSNGIVADNDFALQCMLEDYSS